MTAVASSPRARTACTHCGLPVPSALVRAERSEQFCCDGCELVYGTLQDAGLGGDYYALRQSFEARDEAEPARATGRSYAAFDRDKFTDAYVHPIGDSAADLSEVELLLEGVHCAACVWLVERLSALVEGVVDARLVVRDARVTIRFRPSIATPSAIARGLDRMGYPAHPPRKEAAREAARASERRHLMRMGVAAVCAGNAMLVAFALYSATEESSIESGHAALFRWTGLGLGWLSILWPGRGFLRGAWAALKTRSPNLDLPISIALVVGALAGTWNTAFGTGEAYFDSLTVLVFLLLVGRYVQARQQRWAADAVDLTRALTPAGCRVVVDDATGATEEITIDELETGDTVQVLAGEPIPADGMIVHGRSSVDRSLLSGEADPISVHAGDEVHAGCQNLSGVLTVKVTQCGESSRVGRLMELVQKGLREKPPIERFTDRIAGVFVVTVCGLAAGTFLYWAAARGDLGAAVDHTVALLIVACPCALGLATPLSLAVAVGRAARTGLLVKDAAVFERLAKGGRLVLDKTGTITEGSAQLTGWFGDESVRSAVCALEASSVHPIARALVRGLEPFAVDGSRATDVTEKLNGGVAGTVYGRRIQVGSVAYFARQGLKLNSPLERARQDAESRGMSVVCVHAELDGNDKAELCAIATLADAPRARAREVIADLESLGWAPEILSGDGQGAVSRVAAAVGVDRAVGAAEPEAKLARVAELQAQGETVVMVGDGVNDAAALAAADVGIAVHGGAEISLAAADVFASRSGLAPLSDLVRLARRTMFTIRCNLAVSLIYNAAGITLAALGFMSPLLAAILMPISSITVLSLAIALFSAPSRSKVGGTIQRPKPAPSHTPAPCP